MVFALPRSRTAWLAHWLTAPDHPVGHDTIIECNRLSDFAENFTNGMRGTIETGAVEGWRQIIAAFPQGRFLTIRRPLEEVHQSLMRFGLDVKLELLQREALLNEIEAEGFAERVDFVDLRQHGCRKWIWNYLLPEFPFDVERDIMLAQVNIQVDMQARLVQLAGRAAAMVVLKEELLCATN